MESVPLMAVRLGAMMAGAQLSSLIVVVEGEQTAEALARLLHQFDPDCVVSHFPAWDCLPYDRAAPSPEIMGHRMRVLGRLWRGSTDRVLVTTPEALVQRVPARPSGVTRVVAQCGATLNLEALQGAATRMGYLHADRVEDPGQIALRGEVVDVYPAARRPYRINLDGDRVTAIHTFDPASQRTVASLDVVRIDAVSEVLMEADRFAGMEHWLPEFGRTETLLELMPDTPVTLLPKAAERLDGLFGQIEDAYRERLAADAKSADAPRRAIAPDRLYVPAAAWRDQATRLVPFPSIGAADEAPRFCLDDKPGQSFIRAVEDGRKAGLRFVLSGARDHDLELLAKQAERAIGRSPTVMQRWGDAASLEAGGIGLMRLCADHGFVDHDARLALVTAADLLGHHFRALSTRAVPVPWHLGDGDFATGDLVIHLDHGLSVLKGLERFTTAAGAEGDAVRLGFAKEADLIVPVEELDRVWRYSGPTDDVALDKLDTDAWQKRRAKIAREIDATAQHLVEVAHKRHRAKAPEIVPPRLDYERFVAGFPFAPTADQMHAIDDCLRDLAGPRPMDRLVVGDVGFGKTEVALRAAAAAALAGWQVAVVAPTTVLVRQHVQHFERRFASLGIGVAQLSRLVSAQDAAAVKAGLRDGSIRLVVGTQALAAEDVGFAKLGLLIIDEEQRLGTADKLAVRRLGQGTHVLTLSATPIPRTLQSALVGLQDLSLMATPPARRRPIRTLLTPFDQATLNTALMREKARGGQSFVVVPRIEDLAPLEAALRADLPELSVLVGHGQMDGHAVDETMTAFASGRADVLLATSIIESGLDVPRANTMVISGAERFGLAELHQLRGRVGRGGRQGVCYLMTAPGHAIAPSTEKRLATLTRLDRLGSGMAISAQDLDARGAGDLTGDDQAGHMHLIGLGLYQHLLQRAIRQIGGEDVEMWTPELHLGDSGSLSADYIPEPEVRLNLYARLARVDDARDVDRLAEEIEDRFGPLPEPCRALLARARLRSLCRGHRIARIDVGPKAVAFTPVRGTAPEALLQHATAKQTAASRIKDGRLLYTVDPDVNPAERMRLSEKLLHAMV